MILQDDVVECAVVDSIVTACRKTLPYAVGFTVEGSLKISLITREIIAIKVNETGEGNLKYKKKMKRKSGTSESEDFVSINSGKPKRGRTRQFGEEVAQTDLMNNTSKIEISAELTPSTGKKKRGRPRKVKLPESISPGVSTVDSSLVSGNRRSSKSINYQESQSDEEDNYYSILNEDNQEETYIPDTDNSNALTSTQSVPFKQEVEEILNEKDTALMPPGGIVIKEETMCDGSSPVMVGETHLGVQMLKNLAVQLSTGMEATDATQSVATKSPTKEEVNVDSPSSGQAEEQRNTQPVSSQPRKVFDDKKGSKALNVSNSAEGGKKEETVADETIESAKQPPEKMDDLKTTEECTNGKDEGVQSDLVESEEYKELKNIINKAETGEEDQDTTGKKKWKQVRDLVEIIGKKWKAPYICYCGNVYNILQSFRVHVYLHLGRYQCHFCQKKFASKTSKAEHMRSHTGEKPFICEVCGKRFKTKKAVAKHTPLHDKVKPFKCLLCPKAFGCDSLLKKHLNLHSEEKNFVCTFCGKAFRQKTTLNDHERLHTGERPHKCHLCPKTFVKSSGLHVHIRRHLKKKVEKVYSGPYQCSYCEKRFPQKVNRAIHERTHTGEKPFVCEICGTRFMDYTGRKRHINSIHLGVKFQCSYCEKQYSDRGSLKDHVRKYHFDEGQQIFEKKLE